MRQEAPQSIDMTLRDYIGILRARRAIILISLLTVVIAALAYILFVPRVYESTSSLLVEGTSPNYARRGAEDPFGDLYGLPPAHTAATAAQVLTGPDFLNQLYRTSNLRPGDVSFKVQQVLGTDVVTVAADSADPKKALRMAQVAPQTYIDFSNKVRSKEIDDTIAYAQNRLQEKSGELSKAELALQNFQDRNNIPDLAKQRDARIAVAVKQDSDIRDMRIGLDAAKAQLAELSSLRVSTPKSINDAAALTNPRIEETKKTLAALETARAKTLTYFKPSDAHVQEIDAEIASAKAELKSMSPMVNASRRERNPLLLEEDRKLADSRADVARRQAELDKAVAANAGVANAINHYIVLERRLSDLQRTVDQDKTTVMMLAANVEGLALRKRAIHNSAELVAPASPAVLVTPNIPVVSIVAVLLGLIVGLTLALLQENLDGRLRTEQAHRILGVPALGYVPLVRAKGEWLYTPPYATFLLECYRVLRTNLLFAAKDKPNFSVLVSSTQSGEGKTITAANVSIVLARSGKRVILVDADLHAPAIHEQFGLSMESGLTDLLLGDMPLDQALKSTPFDGLHVITAGAFHPNCGELLISDAMQKLHRTLGSNADVIVYDGPPFLSGADSLMLAAQVDGLVYVVQEGRVTSTSLHYVADLLSHSGANVLGVVYNKVNPRDTLNQRYDSSNRRYQEIPIEETQRVQQETADWAGNSIVKHIVLAAAPGAMHANGHGPEPAVLVAGNTSSREQTRE